jgi:hypothetical protein
MDAGVPLATIQRWLGHANISQTSIYLGASLGGDEQDMHAYEAAVGRRPFVGESKGRPESLVTRGDAFSGSDGSQGASSDHGTSEKTQENPMVH